MFALSLQFGLVLLGVSALLYFVLLSLYNIFLHPLRQFPGPFLASGTRLWLVYHTYRRQRHVLDLCLHAKYGAYVRIAPNELLINDIHCFKPVYGVGTQFNKSTWYQSMNNPSEDGFNLLAETNMDLYWRQKRAISPAFTTQAVQQHENLLARPLHNFVMRMKTDSGIPQDLVKWMNILALDLLTEMTFSKSADYISRGTDDGNCEVIDKFWQHLSWIGLLPGFCHFYQGLQRLLESLHLPILYKPDTSRLSIIQVYVLNSLE